MKLRCPYCKHLIEGDPKPQCPSCGKTMMLPDRLLRSDKKEARRKREAIARDAELKKKAMGLGEFKVGGKPSGVIFAVALLSFAGILLISRAKAPSKATGIRTREDKALQDLGVLSIALNRFRSDCGRYPTTEEGLKALIVNPGITNWPKSYVNLIRPDPWRQHYFYASSNETYALFSAGPDKTLYTEDDVYPPLTMNPEREAQPEATGARE